MTETEPGSAVWTLVFTAKHMPVTLSRGRYQHIPAGLHQTEVLFELLVAARARDEARGLVPPGPPPNLHALTEQTPGHFTAWCPGVIPVPLHCSCAFV